MTDEKPADVPGDAPPEGEAQVKIRDFSLIFFAVATFKGGKKKSPDSIERTSLHKILFTNNFHIALFFKLSILK